MQASRPKADTRNTHPRSRYPLLERPYPAVTHRWNSACTGARALLPRRTARATCPQRRADSGLCRQSLCNEGAGRPEQARRMVQHRMAPDAACRVSAESTTRLRSLPSRRVALSQRSHGTPATERALGEGALTLSDLAGAWYNRFEPGPGLLRGVRTSSGQPANRGGC